ncbi:hypothetical protein ABZ761_33400, partial [Kitasatospora sp. NPDC006786]|uniref:hypothetical protein n=1 Tax=Kitasatospora sp. NPDC006786 TaxID=3157187 RepID=UPI0033C1F8C9
MRRTARVRSRAPRLFPCAAALVAAAGLSQFAAPAAHRATAAPAAAVAGCADGGADAAGAAGAAG